MPSREPNEDADLAIAASFFSQFGLTVERFSKDETRSGKTPDFRLLKGGKLVAFCEVKSPRDDWLHDMVDQKPDAIVGGLRNDPTFNRIARFVEKAAEQFQAVNHNRQYPNILFIVNHDEASGYYDLCETLTGEFQSDDGSRHATVKNVSEGKIKDLKRTIDAYAWYQVDSEKLEGWFFSFSVQAHTDLICAMFNIDATKTRCV